MSSPGAVRSPATLIKARRPLPAEVLGHVNNTVAGLGDLSAVAPLASAPTRPAASLPCAIRPKKVPNPNCRVTLGTRRVRLRRELVTGTRRADNWGRRCCNCEAEWRYLNASTYEVVFRTLWSSVSAPWIRLDAQQRKSGADLLLHAFPAIRRELWMRRTVARVVGDANGLQFGLPLVLGPPGHAITAKVRP